MRLRHIEVFQAIRQTGSVSAAAQLLHVSQPAVSKVLQHAEQRLRFVFQGGFNRGGSFEFPEKWFDAKHHDGVGDRRDVRAQVLAGKGLDVSQDANGHQWVLQYDACDVSTADRVDAFVALFKPSGCLPEDGHLLAAEKRHPVINVF